MVRSIRRKGKKAAVRKKAEERKKREAEAAILGSAEKRARYGDSGDEDEDDEPMYEAADESGYIGDDDDSDGIDDLRESSMPLGANDFDEDDLAQSLIDHAIDPTAAVVEDEAGEEKFAEDDGPTYQEQLELADYQLADEPDEHEDEAYDLFDDDEADLVDLTAEPDQTKPQALDPVQVEPAQAEPEPVISDQPVEQPVIADEPVEIGSIVVATHRATAPGEMPTDPYSGSTPINQPRKNRYVNDFSMAMGIFCIDNGISRAQYIAMREILQLLKKGDGLAQLDKLPDTVDTLKSHVREQLPHLGIRSKTVALNAKKISTSRKITALMGDQDPSMPTQNLYFMDPVSMFGRVLSSTLASKMHFGMAQLVDNPTEAWHSQQWAGMIRTTSGDLVYYPDVAPLADDGGKDPIFPGDIINFQCAYQKCPTCQGNTTKLHVGQVFGIYRDQRTARILGDTKTELSGTSNVKLDVVEFNEPVLLVARIFASDNLRAIHQRRKVKIRANDIKAKDLFKGEQILVIDPLEYVDPKKVTQRVDIPFDYGFGSSMSFENDPVPSADNPYIRRVFHTQHSVFLPVGKIAPVPGTLEVNQFGRNELIKKFARSSKVMSMPMYNFDDGFGLYRTMRKSIMGVYMLIVALPKNEHTRQANVYPLTLGPYGSNFEDVIKALAPMRFLDEGMMVNIKGTDVLVCAPLLALIGDMVQQNQNAGCLSVAGNLGCRACVIHSINRGDLNFDVVLNARSHYELLRQRRALDGLPTKGRKDVFSTKYGISVTKPAVVNISPALDLVAGRPGDTAHSEFNGITKMVHQLLLDAAFTSNGAVEYAKVLRRMPFPPGWAQIQSPFHVLSYTLAEHARWALLMTIISLLWLQESHLKTNFVKAVKVVFADEIRQGKSVPNIITIILARVVKSNSLLSATELDPKDRDPNTFKAAIIETRRLFQRLCEAAAMSARAPRGAAAAAAQSRIASMMPPTRRATPTTGPSIPGPSVAGPSRPATPGPQTRARARSQSVVSSVGGGEDVEQEMGGEEPMQSVEQEQVAEDINLGHLTAAQKAAKYHQWGARPNVHAGLHYIDDLGRYGLPSLQMVLPGEVKHKKYKALVIKGNHRNPEKDALIHEDLIQTIRLTLHNGFEHDDPEITAQIKTLAANVPTLFRALLPRDAQAEDDDGVIAVRTVGDINHVEPAAMVRLQSKACQASGLPVREGQMSYAFRVLLSRAYSSDYNKNITIVSDLMMQWWKKIAFATSLAHGTRRSVFARGQYIKFRGTNMGRLDHILTHEAQPRSGVFYVFLIVNPVTSTDRAEPLTELPIMKPSGGGVDILARDEEDYDAARQVIIGLPALDSDKLYMVPYDPDNLTMVTANMETSEDAEVLHVNWRTLFRG